ncbi:KH homology domain-containing protein 1 [Camelus dromedarius]|uniref:KH homology domain-containing protein 1 n=1 Tax=Camelus dromedarius TaxID=9838 RepID=A0A5N4DWL3_CAMDR|nr:KH homology domain-containing protein 1 [Camelus dromedarius]
MFIFSTDPWPFLIAFKPCSDKLLELAPIQQLVGEVKDMEIKPWWVFPENLNFPLEFYIEEEQEEFIFGRLDANLHRIEMHSQTFIQLKMGFTTTSLTRVLVVGPLEGRQWLFHVIRSIGSWDSYNQARGQEML